MAMNFLFKISVISLLFFSCNEDKYIRTYKVPKEIPDNKINQLSFKPENKDSSSPQQISWDSPDSWIKSENTSSMRLASFQVPYYGYDPSKIDYADLSISILSGNGGGIKMNVNRWRNQVGLPPQTLNEIISSAQNLDNSIGAYQVFKIINKSSSDMAFICAVMPMKNNTIFIKLNIPKIGINLVEKDFLDFCGSFKAVGE